MGTPFIGEIRICAFNFAPKGWALCNGQLLPITQNQALFALLGVSHGGDGRSTFALPDMRGRVPMHRSTTHLLGERGGEEGHVLSQNEMPSHTHRMYGASAAATTGAPSGALLGGKGRFGRDLFGPAANAVQMAPQTVANAGGNVAHGNMQPWLGLNFVIALNGAFPSRN